MRYRVIDRGADAKVRVNVPCLVPLLFFSLLLLYIGLHPNPIPFTTLNDRRLFGFRGDHHLHFLAFLVVSLVGPSITRPSVPPAVALAALIVVAVSSEALQGCMPWRSFDWTDVGANMIGITVGCGARRVLVERPWPMESDNALLPLNAVTIVR